MKTHPVFEPKINLVEQLLSEQQTLQTPVVKISEKYDADYKKKRFQHLIPLSEPAADQQFAFQVDLDKCTGCKSCVAACHSLNGLSEKESFRDAGKIINVSQATISFQQTVTSACHHCVDPGCMNGCPVNAYEKDSITGIVKHLDDQCIGCQYCVMKCPYDVPKYHKKKGIVRKCDMCHQRLSVGEAPACVQSCPHEAISITTVSKTEMTSRKAQDFIPGAPDPEYTKPTTLYVGALPESDMEAADKYRLKKEHAHSPLIAMLLFTQLSLGLLVMAMIVLFNGDHSPMLMVTSLALCIAGIGSATLHLGQPLKAWKVFLGLRTSWMSREIIAFTMYMGLLVVLTFILLVPGFVPSVVIKPLVITAILIGVLSVFASVKLYQDTKRQLWAFKYTLPKFYGSVFILTIPVLLALNQLHFISMEYQLSNVLVFVTILAVLIKCYLDIVWLKAGNSKTYTPEKRAALLINKEFKGVFKLRIASLTVGLICLVIGISKPFAFAFPIATMLLFVSEIIERYLFFVTVDSPKMPGN